ncbi:MAG: hypothetical protein ACKO7B_02560 [Flavobacteriales bacterium]
MSSFTNVSEWQIRIPTEHLAAGCYIVKINAANNSSVVPLMIQH